MTRICAIASFQKPRWRAAGAHRGAGLVATRAIVLLEWRGSGNRQWTCGSPNRRRSGLADPHPLLAGRIPRVFAIESELGAREVENLLGRTKFGIPA